MNNTIELLNSHRSIRRFTDQAISEGDLNTIVQSGQAAATSSFCQSVSVIRVVDSTKRQAIAQWAGPQKYIETAAEFLVFCADLARAQALIEQLEGHEQVKGQDAQMESGRFNWTEQLLTATLDTGLFAQNCVVAAQSLGIGICYIGGIRNEIAKVSESLQLPDLVIPLFGLCLGYPDQAPTQKPRLPLASVLFEDQYPSDNIELQPIGKYDQQIKEYYEARTDGKLSQTWSEQLSKQARAQTRPHILSFLHSKGFAHR